MEKNSKIALGLAAVALLLSGVTALLGSDTVIREVVTDRVGVSSPDISSPYFSFGDVRHWAAKENPAGAVFFNASTTICTIPAPAVGSSSLQYFSWKGNTGTGTVMNLKVYKGAAKWALTTQLGDATSLAANTNERIAATSSMLGTPSIFTNGDYLNVAAVVKAGGAGTSSPTGTCQAVWVEL